MSTNEEIVRIFNSMADILEIQEVAWKPRAYREAARSILSLSVDVRGLYKQGGIKLLQERIPGVGEHMSRKIEEYLKTGKIQSYEKLKKSIPEGLRAIMDVPGMGPKKAYALYKKLNIKTLDDLKKAIEQHKIRSLKGFGEVSEAKIQGSLGIAKAHKERVPYDVVAPISNKIINELKKMKEVQKISVGGSLRRKEATIGDIDILVTSKNPEAVMKRFISLPMVQRITAKGLKKSEIVLKNGMQADLRVVEDKSFGAAMQYFTGNKAHNIALRKIAIKKGYKLNEYGVFKGNKMIAGKTEEDIYKVLGLKYIPPEKRKNEGELEAYSIE